MWKNIGKSFKRVFEKVFRNSEIKNKNENESIEADIKEEVNEENELPIDSSSDEMELQIDGNWVSKNIIQSLFVCDERQKLLKVCAQKDLFKLENIITKELVNYLSNLILFNEINIFLTFVSKEYQKK